MRLWFYNKGQKPGDILSNLQKDVKSKMPKIPGIPKNLELKLPASVNVKSLTEFVQRMITELKQSTSAPSGPSRPMKFPYTFSAKLAQFPYRHYYTHNWIFRWYPMGIACCIPVFWYIGRMSKSKENKATWKKIRRDEKEHVKHKFDY